MRILRVGDPHIKKSNLEESEAFMHWLVDLILKEKPDRVEILGDLFHTHEVIRVEVLDFWNEWLDIISESADTWVILGNHDMAGDYNTRTHALVPFRRIKRKTFHLVENAQHDSLYAYVPYHHDKNSFVEIANHLADAGAKVLVCHQTFSGSHFENGMYAPDGIDPILLKYDLIISGHIHMAQSFGNVTYPGTWKWDTASDANQVKGVTIYDHNDVTGLIESSTFFGTQDVCMPIYTFEWEEGQEKPVIPARGKTTLLLKGTSKWVELQKKDLKGKVALQSKITDFTKREKQATSKNFLDFVQNNFASSIDKEILKKYLEELKFV